VATEEVPEKVLRFLDSYIDSIEQLRVLLLLYSDPSRIWTTAQVTAELRSSDTSIVKRLEDLYARGVLERRPELGGAHRFTPCTEELVDAIDCVARENQVRPYRLIEAIYSRPNRALRDFADAFKFRGDKS
jgi:hypothetical protein